MHRKVSLRAKAGEIFFHRHLKAKMTSRVFLQSYARHIARVPCLAGAPDEPVTAG